MERCRPSNRVNSSPSIFLDFRPYNNSLHLTITRLGGLYELGMV
jgi:hypothetical protein